MYRKIAVLFLQLLIVGLLFVLSIGLVSACSVPVFRYALEMWRPDAYSVVILHKGALSEEEQAAIEVLKGYESGGDILANIHVRVVDIDQEPDYAKEEKPPAEGKARLCVYFPPSPWSREPIKAWEGELSHSSALALAESPVRKQLYERLIDGESAVWIFLESGDKKKDEAAYQVLSEQLKKLEKELELPQIEASDDPLETYFASPDTEPLKIVFSVLSVSRTDVKESFLVSALVNSESDLHEYAGEPIAFPVFGRGRNLYALVGKGINPETLLDASQFIIGECSCELKDENPGMDLLLAANWDLAIDSLDYSEIVLPPLVGPATLVSSMNATSATEDAELTAPSEEAERERKNVQQMEIAKRRQATTMSEEEGMVKAARIRLLIVALGAVGVVGMIVLIFSFVVMGGKRS